MAGERFDVAILAVPPPVQKEICGPLLAVSDRYQTMLEGTNTVVTQAAQLWLDRTPKQLGWRWSSNSLMSMYVEPVDTYCDMGHLLPSSTGRPTTTCGISPTSAASSPRRGQDSRGRGGERPALYA